MAMTQDSYLTATDFANLKARVKAEMQRRDGNGSLVAYTAATYDYTAAAAAGVTIKEEHYDKIRDLMANINATTVSLGAKTVGDLIVAMNALETNMTAFELKPRGERTTSDCSSLCTGMCIAQCTTTCISCTGTCTGGCTSCSGDCDGGCDGCDGDCSGICADDCSGDCDGTCEGGCGYGCGSSCTGGCDGPGTYI